MKNIRSREKSTVVLNVCRKFKDLPSRALARVLYKNHRTLFPNLDAAYQAVRYRRGNMGAGKRKHACATGAELVRPNGVSTDVVTWQFPKSSAPSYAPFYLDEARTLVISDLHIPFHDRGAIDAVMERAVRVDPTCILINGDLCDFFSISRFEKNPKESSLIKELDLTRQFFGWLRQKFPKARIIMKPGNHDEWFDRYLVAKAPELLGVPGISMEHLTTGPVPGKTPVDGIEWVADQRKIMIGKLNIWHGHEIGKGSIAPPVNPARGLFMRTLECGLMGHLHKDSAHTESSVNGKLIATWSTGCLCGLWPRYARVNKWTHSAAIVHLSAGQFSVAALRILNGKVL